jgi:hypothetical protein
MAAPLVRPVAWANSGVIGAIAGPNRGPVTFLTENYPNRRLAISADLTILMVIPA